MLRHHLRTLALTAAILVLAAGCTEDLAGPDAAPLAATDAGTLRAAPADAGNVARERVWADGRLFDTVVPPTSFKPDHGPFDELYATGGNGTFADGVGLISGAKPGDRDYNGGRWHLNVLKPTVDPAKYAGATGDADLDPADFTSTDQYFECPMLPRR